MKEQHFITVKAGLAGIVFILSIIALSIHHASANSIIEEVTLQGPDVTWDTQVSSWRDNTNYGTNSRMEVRERGANSFMFSMIEFDLSDYIGGLPVEDVRIFLYHDRVIDGTATQDFGIRPMKVSWIAGDGDEVGSTFNHRDAPNGDLEWAEGNIRDGHADEVNFGARLATTPVEGGNFQWYVWESQELDDFVNAVINEEEDYYGFFLEAGFNTWGENTRYGFRTSNCTIDDPEVLQPRMEFNVIPEPSTLALLGLTGLLLLKRRRV